MEVAITGMVIRGHSNRWVEKFSLQYSNDGSTWVYYNEDGEESEPVRAIIKLVIKYLSLCI